MKRLYIAAIACSALLQTSCASKDAQQKVDEAAPASPTEAVADEARNVRRDQQPSEREKVVVGVEDLVRTNNEFAFDLYKSVRSDDVAISPHGVASMLALAHAGAGGDTAGEIAETLRAELGESDMHQKFGQLNAVLRQREASSGAGDKRGFRLRVVNAVWHAPNVHPEPAFSRIATNQHLAEQRALDFPNEPERARDAINAFVKDATAGKIPEVVRAGELSPLTRLVLTNSVYFDAPWAVPFDRALTGPARFHAPGGPKNVLMMRTLDRFAYLDGDGFTLVELPYGHGDVVATVILPDEGNDHFDAGITADYFDWMLSQARQTRVEVRLPRFELDERYELSSTLRGMGLKSAFDPEKADFSRLARTENPLFLGNVIHQTHIRVDEEGTEAAAATATAVIEGGAADEPVEFVADRPFLFVVRDSPTDAILFMARVSNP